MALATYADLTGAVASWLARADLTATIPDFVTLFEAAFNRNVRVRRMEATSTLTPDANGEATVPADFLEYRRLTWTGTTRRTLTFVEPEYFQSVNPARTSDTPRFFTIEGLTLKVTPLDTTAVELAYYQKLPTLSTALNWLMTQHPDCYLFGTLAEANAFTKNPDAAGLWKQRRDEVISEILRLDMMAKAPSAMRVMDSPTP